MAKRKSNNRRLSKYNRSSIGSGILDPNSEVLGEEESFWWNNLTKSSNPLKFNASNETSKHLDSNSQIISNTSGMWWDDLDSSDDKISNYLPKTQSQKQPVVDTIPETTNTHNILDSDKEDRSPPIQRKKIQIRGKSKRSRSNAFLKAINDSTSSELSKEISIRNPINTSANYKSLEGSNFTGKHAIRRDSNTISSSTSTDQTTDKILKPKPTIFGRKYRQKKENVFENVLNFVEDEHSDPEKTPMIPTNSVNPSIEKDHISSKNISTESKGHPLDSGDEEDIIRYANDENIISHALSPIKHGKTNLETEDVHVRVSLRHNDSNIIHDNARGVSITSISKDLASTSITNISYKQASIISSHSNASFIENAMTDINKSTKSKIPSPTSLFKSASVNTTFNSNERNISKNNDEAQPKEIDMSTSKSKQNFEQVMEIVADNNQHKIVNSINNNHQKKIDEYFVPSTSKSIFLIDTNQSKSNLSKKIKKKNIKARLEESKKMLGGIMDLNKIEKVTQLKQKEIMEKIKKLKNEGTNKRPSKAKISKAYLVNGKVYKRPKLPRPQSWVTDRMYRYLWKIMEPKYKLTTRVESENFVKKLCKAVNTIIKSKKYENYQEVLDHLMNQMARLGIIRTRNDFYDFCHEFLPYDFRIKVVPMRCPGNVRNIPYDPEKLHEHLLEE